MLRTGTVVKGVVVLAVAVAAFLAAPVLWLAISEDAMPPSSSLPALPDGARVVAEEKGCGSGGCWLELTVDAPAGMSGEDLASEVLPDGEACAVRSVLDRRRVCTWVMEVEAGSAQFNMQYDRGPL
ncbi:hypothetical protein C8K30_109239 [Promicromonospora sp. AC04]|uniref:hypothetical protein n=1 Tax=Promicromonospora sp. AC04 TaxID=2135723 RepID=UPI000D370939|nr:hypothetical protein [Promicromonospora sp. AC04]PUB24487.1 hypothetical protein C8K30_109239 [Promicromonospora sp. AC04]